MKKNLYIILLIIVNIIFINNANASSGALKKASIKICNGIIYGQHSSDNHWHVAKEKDGMYYATGDPIYIDPCSSNTNNTNDNINSSNSNNDETNNINNDNSNNNINNNAQDQKNHQSSDNTLKSIIIDEKNIEVADYIEYTTTKENIDIIVETNDNKASYEIKNNDILTLGQNNIIIEVAAEDGSLKVYNINVERKKILSSNTEINITFDNKKVVFTNYKATVYVDFFTKKINIDYVLKDKNSQVKMNELTTLKTGNNILNIEVIAEDNTTQKYEINIYKYSKNEDTIYTILGLGILCVVIYGIYYLIKKIKQKR